MSTVVELSPEQARTSLEDLNFGREETETSSTCLAQG